MTSIQVKGGEQLTRVTRALESHADGRSLRNKMRRDFRSAGSAITKDQRAGLAAKLPHRGGLASTLATEGRFTVSTALAGKQARVTIVDSWKGHDMAGIDSGLIRHPLWGNRRHWYATKTSRGLLSRPVTARKRSIQRAIIRSLDEIAAEIAKES